MCKLLWTCISLCLFLAVNCHAASEDISLDEALARAEAEHLASSLEWHRLLAYQPQRFRTGYVISDILSDDFFIAENGKTNPEAELRANINAFFTTSVSPDTSFHCRFPARSFWLQKRLSIVSNDYKSQCKSYLEWLGPEPIDSASLVFATGYMSNPASFFGHILLKFNATEHKQSQGLLDTAINYGARVPENENMLIYAVKGLFGVYDASYSQKEYYAFTHLYAEEDLRDVWQYELSLSSDQIELLAAVIWERLGKTYRYFYLRQNCAYRMAELLELVTGREFYSRIQPWVIPSDLFNRLIDIGNDELVKSISFEPSRLNRFYSKYEQLSTVQQLAVRHYIENNSLVTELNNVDKAKIYETLFDYYEYLRVGGVSVGSQVKRDLLLGRMDQVANINWLPVDSIPPHHSVKPGMLRFSGVNNEDRGSALEVTLQAAYYDYLSLPGARVPDSELIMGRATFWAQQDSFRLQQFDVFSVSTLNTSKTSLPGDGGIGWNLRFGWLALENRCDDCLQLNITGGLSKAYKLNDQATIFSGVNGSLFESIHQSGHASVTFELGVLAGLFDSWSTKLTLGYEEFVENASYSGLRLNWQNRIGTSRNWDFRLNYEYDNSDTVSLGLSHYW